MTEHNKEGFKIAGDVSETSSSNSFIQNQVDSLHGEIYGISGNVIEVQPGDVLPYKTINSKLEDKQEYSKVIIEWKKQSYKYSRSAGLVRLGREEKRKLKKAA